MNYKQLHSGGNHSKKMEMMGKQLLDASRDGKLEDVCRLIKSGVDVEVKESSFVRARGWYMFAYIFIYDTSYILLVAGVCILDFTLIIMFTLVLYYSFVERV